MKTERHLPSTRTEHQRRLGTFYQPGWDLFARPWPLLQLAGPWLAEAGFAPGDEVRVVVRQGRLLVVRRDLDPEWLEDFELDVDELDEEG